MAIQEASGMMKQRGKEVERSSMGDSQRHGRGSNHAGEGQS